MALRWTRIDETQREDHWYLTEDDHCIFLGDYNAGDGFAETTDQALNSTIHNLKKLPTDPNARYRAQAVDRCVRALSVLNTEWVNSVTWVPVPPSKIKTDPSYNPKMLDVLRGVTAHGEMDVRELIFQQESTRTSHQSETRVSIDELVNVYRIDEGLSEPEPERIVLLDDVLTTGTHFKAMKATLQQRFPDCYIYGLFFTRRIPRSVDPYEDFDDLD